MPQPQSFYFNSGKLFEDAENAARAAGFEPNNFNLDIFAMSYNQGFPYAGIASVGARGTALNGVFDLRVTAHELGHNYGLLHANLWQTTDGSTIGPGNNVEYGNPFDVMGGGGDSRAHFTAHYKRRLDWLTDKDVQVIDKDGVYRVFAHDSITSGGIRALTLRKNSEKNYWIEFRQLFDIPSVLNGAIINWDYRSRDFREIQILDMTPATPNTVDAPLQVGNTFNDDENRIRITVLGKGNTTPESLDVKVELNVGCTFSLNQTSQSFTGSGGEGSIPLNTLTGCRPSATSNGNWIHPIQGDTSPVRYVVAANYDSLPRTGTITVAGQTFTVQQGGATTSCAPQPSGLVAWWQGEGNGLDRTGTNHGALVKNTNFAGGKVGGGILGDFTNRGGYVEVPDSPSLTLTKSITIEGWVKLNAASGYVLRRSINNFPFLGSYEVNVFGGNISFLIWFNSNSGVGVFSDSVPLGQFIHFAATLDDNSGLISMYINGNLARQFTVTQRPNIAAGATVIVGDLDGITDEISVYNRALLASEILAIYNAGNAATGAAGKCLSSSTQITIQSNPAGRTVSIDGAPPVTTPQIVNWAPGSSHTIATTSPQAGSAGTQYVWSNWSDGGAISHSVTTPVVNTTYTANFTTQFLLTTNAGTGGSVLPASGFFNSGQSVQISALANPGFSFTGWTGTGTGSFTGSTNPVSVTMNGPISETAAFSQNPVQITVQTNPTGRTISIDGGSAVIAPQVVQWQPGSVHTIATTSPQAGSPGTQFVWSNWSDGGAISHSVTTPAVNTTYTANFTKQVLPTLELLLEEAGPASNQVSALESVLFLRDPFPVVNPANFFNFGNDRNTRLLIFVAKLQLAPGESPSAVIVNLIDSNNKSQDIAAEHVWIGANADFSQITFRLPDGLPPGTCTIMVKLHDQFSNAGTIRIKP